jgi:hypothetical protein
LQPGTGDIKRSRDDVFSSLPYGAGQILWGVAELALAQLKRKSGNAFLKPFHRRTARKISICCKSFQQFC